MTLVEGVGDEVTQFFCVLVVVLLGLAAWWSTHIDDTPLLRTVLILERRTRRRGTVDRYRERQQLRDSRQRLSTSAATNSADAERSAEDAEPDTGQSEQNEEVAEGVSSDENKEESESAAPSSRATPTSDLEGDSPEAPPPQQATLPTTRQPMATPPPVQQAQEEEACQVRRRRLAFLENMAGAAAPTEAEAQADDSSGAGSIRIRLKYLNDEQKLVQGQLQEPLGDFRRRHFSLELDSNKLVRLIFNGQVLARDTVSLEDHGLFDNCVVHCLVHQARAASDSQQASNNTASPMRDGTRVDGERREWDLGSFVFMFLSVMLGLAWYGRCVYSHYFTTTASVALIGLTGVFVVSVVGLVLPDQDGLRQ